MDNDSNVDLKPNDDTISLSATQLSGTTDKAILREETTPIAPVKDNSREDRFCREYVNNGKQLCKAVLDSGYRSKTPQSTGALLLKRQRIIDRIAHYSKQLEAQLNKTKPKLLQELQDLTERCRRAGRLGEELRALELSAKVCGLLDDGGKTQINLFSTLSSIESKLGAQVIDVPPETTTTDSST